MTTATPQFITVTTEDFDGNVIETYRERVYTVNDMTDLTGQMPGAILSRLIDFGNENVEDDDAEDWVSALSDLGYLINSESHRIGTWTFTKDTLSDILA